MFLRLNILSILIIEVFKEIKKGMKKGKYVVFFKLVDL